MSDLLQNHMSTSHTIRAHAQEVEINWTKIKFGCQSGNKEVPHNFKSDLPLDDLFPLQVLYTFKGERA